MDTFLNSKYEVNLSTHSGASETHIHTKCHTAVNISTLILLTALSKSTHLPVSTEISPELHISLAF